MKLLLGTATSKNGNTIHLTEERWLHIVSTHKEIDPTGFSGVLEAIQNPDFILKGYKDELLAVKKKVGRSRWLVVPYKETAGREGFVLTAYITTDARWLFKKESVWSKK